MRKLHEAGGGLLLSTENLMPQKFLEWGRGGTVSPWLSPGQFEQKILC